MPYVPSPSPNSVKTPMFYLLLHLVHILKKKKKKSPDILFKTSLVRIFTSAQLREKVMASGTVSDLKT